MTTVAQQAVDAAMEVECKKDSLKQNQDGTWKFTLTIAPGGLPDAMMKAPPGTRYTAVFVEVDDVEEPVKRAPAAPKKPRRPFHDLPLSQQAALRCNNHRFSDFLQERHSTRWQMNNNLSEPEAIAAQVVRSFCGVTTRADLNDSSAAILAWKALNAEYEKFAGLSAEER